MALFPFEPPYFNNVGLSCDFVGHPIVSEDTATKENIIELKTQYSLGDDPVILCLPGSRKSEINRLMPTFGKTLERFSNVLPNSRFIIQKLVILAQIRSTEIAFFRFPRQKKFIQRFF